MELLPRAFSWGEDHVAHAPWRSEHIRLSCWRIQVHDAAEPDHAQALNPSPQILENLSLKALRSQKNPTGPKPTSPKPEILKP